MAKILLVEDDSEVCAFINKGLAEQGYDVSVAMEGLQGKQMAITHEYDLIILDIMLPGINGIEICKAVREMRQTPILFLTALGSTENVVLGLDSGADDYLKKPFKFIELLARVRTLLRRSPMQTTSDQEDVYTFSDLVLDDQTKTVKRGGVEVSLTSTEYRLLFMFIKNAKRVLSRVDMLEEVWGVQFDLGTNVVDVYVNYLRKKLEKVNPKRLIHTVIGMGYVLKEES